MSRAADRLALSQPAVSNALNRLRDTLDDALLVRRGNGMHPTARARTLFPHIRTALEAVTRGLEGLQSFTPEALNGALKIGIDQYSLDLLGASLLSTLHAEAPGLSVSMINAPPHEREADLMRGAFDFLIGQVWRPTPRIARKILFTEHFVGLVRQDHPRLGDIQNLETYLSLDHILFSEVGRVPRNVDYGLKRLGRDRKVTIDLPSLTVAARLVATSDAIMNIGARMAADLAAQHSLAVFDLPLEVPGFEIGILWPEHDGDAKLTLWLVDLVARLAGAQGKQGD